MDILVTMVSIHLEAVEQAPCVFCYHAKLTLSLEWSDGTPDAVSHSGGQVSRLWRGVMAHLMLSANLWARLVELLTKLD